MEAAASSLSSLLATLRVDGPWTPPATWDSITRQSTFAGVADPTGSPPMDPIYELTSVPVSEFHEPFYLLIYFLTCCVY
jgi:gamma-tubulin complex component 6